MLSNAKHGEIIGGQLRPVSTERGKRLVKGVVTSRRFWAIALVRFFAEPTWQTFSFWILFYFINKRRFDLKTIATLTWLPFLAADLGGLAGGYSSPLLIKRSRIPLVWPRIRGIVLGVFMVISSACVGFMASPYTVITLFCVGGFAHQMISSLVNTLSAGVFDPEKAGTTGGFAGMPAWIGGLGFLLLVGALAGKVGYGSLFGLPDAFDLIGAVLLIVLIHGRSYEERAAREMKLSASGQVETDADVGSLPIRSTGA